MPLDKQRQRPLSAACFQFLEGGAEQALTASIGLHLVYDPDHRDYLFYDPRRASAEHRSAAGGGVGVLDYQQPLAQQVTEELAPRRMKAAASRKIEG